MTPTIQSSQKEKFKLLVRSSFALKDPLVSLLPSTPPNGQRYHPPNILYPTSLQSSPPGLQYFYFISLVYGLFLLIAGMLVLELVPAHSSTQTNRVLERTIQNVVQKGEGQSREL